MPSQEKKLRIRNAGGALVTRRIRKVVTRRVTNREVRKPPA
jgi:hypothetical protein